MEGGPLEPQFEIRVPEEVEGGTYSNMVGVWHTGHEFTLDFSVTLPPSQTDEGIVVPCQVVARIKVAPSLVFDLLQTLNQNMTRYEEAFGEIRRPEPQEGDGDD